MKAGANGALNLSTLDGWWDEVWNDADPGRHRSAGASGPACATTTSTPRTRVTPSRSTTPSSTGSFPASTTVAQTVFPAPGWPRFASPWGPWPPPGTPTGWFATTSRPFLPAGCASRAKARREGSLEGSLSCARPSSGLQRRLARGPGGPRAPHRRAGWRRRGRHHGRARSARPSDVAVQLWVAPLLGGPYPMESELVGRIGFTTRSRALSPTRTALGPSSPSASYPRRTCWTTHYVPGLITWSD